jgi:hypothetical protein
MCTHIKSTNYEDYTDNSEKINVFLLLVRLLGQLEEKYFDYFIDYICVNCDLPRSGALAVAHSRKLSATLGGSTSTRP